MVVTIYSGGSLSQVVAIDSGKLHGFRVKSLITVGPGEGCSEFTKGGGHFALRVFAAVNGRYNRVEGTTCSATGQSAGHK